MKRLPFFGSAELRCEAQELGGLAAARVTGDELANMARLTCDAGVPYALLDPPEPVTALDRGEIFVQGGLVLRRQRSCRIACRTDLARLPGGQRQRGLEWQALHARSISRRDGRRPPAGRSHRRAGDRQRRRGVGERERRVLVDERGLVGEQAEGP